MDGLLILGGAVFALMGAAHALGTLYDAFVPTFFTPIDDSVRTAMRGTGVRLARGRPTTIWEAWLGFNLSHGLGAAVFGLAVILVGVDLATLGLSREALLVPVAIGALYLGLALRYWYYLPAIGIGLGTACFVAAWWSYPAGA